MLVLIKWILLFLFCLRTIGDRIGEGKASGNLGNTLKVLGRFDEAVVCCQRHLDISQEQGDKVTSTDIFKIKFPTVNLFLIGWFDPFIFLHLSLVNKTAAFWLTNCNFPPISLSFSMPFLLHLRLERPERCITSGTCSTQRANSSYGAAPRNQGSSPQMSETHCKGLLAFMSEKDSFRTILYN